MAIIRQGLIDDKKAIWDFIRAAYSDSIKYRIPDRWNWEYLDNPSADKSGNKLPIFIAIKDGQIVGQICAIVYQIKIGEEMHRIAGGVDLVTLPNCRGEGIGQRLIRAIAEHYKLYMAISMDPVTRRIYERLEYSKMEPIPIYRRLMKLDRESTSRLLMAITRNHLWLNRIAMIGRTVRLGNIISTVANFLLGLRDRLERHSKKECRSEIREVERFGDEIDQLWRATNHKFKVIVKRDQQYLNWRFSDSTQLDYRKFVITRDGQTRGYIVLRMPQPVERNDGIIVDLFAAPEDSETIEQLIRHAIDFFGKKVTMIECPATQKEYQEVLSKSGFFKFGKVEPIFYCMGSSLRTKLEEWKTNWFLTKADHDWDQLHPL